MYSRFKSLSDSVMDQCVFHPADASSETEVIHSTSSSPNQTSSSTTHRMQFTLKTHPASFAPSSSTTPPSIVPKSDETLFLPSFSHYVYSLFSASSSTSISNADQRSERMFHFFRVPFELEKTLWIGYFACLDSFLDTLIVLPLRCGLAIIKLVNKQPLKHRILDIWKGLLFLFALYGLLYLDPSILYHDIRGQSMLKLYVVFNLLEVCDKLCSSFGLDILDSLYARPTSDHPPFSFPIHFILAFFYIVIHATVFYYQMITLNVAINSHSSALITLLISNQFVEIKSSVFKRFEAENLFQLTCSGNMYLVFSSFF